MSFATSSADSTPLDARVIQSSARVYRRGSSTAYDDASEFSYDLNHGTNSTLPNDTDFKPVESNIPVHTERKLSQTCHKDETFAAIDSGPGVARASTDNPISTKDAVAKRRNSVLTTTAGTSNSTASGAGSKPLPKPSRRATGSLGLDERPKVSAFSETSSSTQPELFFSGGLPDTTSSNK